MKDFLDWLKNKGLTIPFLKVKFGSKANEVDQVKVGPVTVYEPKEIEREVVNAPNVLDEARDFERKDML